MRSLLPSPVLRSRLTPSTLGRDLPASLVVFLVALPLCMGIAVASGVPAEKGLLTGIIGGLVVGVLAGSPLQVSGPAAGLAVLVFELVREHGLAALGPILLLAGLIQIAAGMLRLGQWFRAMSPAVVHGMLSGIGVLIVLAQLHVLLDAKPKANGLDNLTGIPATLATLVPFEGAGAGMALLVGLTTIAAMLGWEKLRPARLRLVPGALIGVVVGTILAWTTSLPIKRVTVPDSIASAISLPTLDSLGELASPAMLLTALAVAFIASAETLLSASAVDRMHNGVRTNYDRELAAQGVGNLLCGVLGGLPMTGVIVRSSANVQAGAVTRLSAVMHGAWILAAVVALPWLLREVPTSALAGVLIVTGWRLVAFHHVRHLLHRYGVLPVAIWTTTFVTVVATDLLTGVLLGTLLTIVEILPFVRRLGLRIRTIQPADGHMELHLRGVASFLHLPRLARKLEELQHRIPAGATLRVRTRGLRHIDHTCAELISDWAERQRGAGMVVMLDPLAGQAHGRPHGRVAVALGI